MLTLVHQMFMIFKRQSTKSSRTIGNLCAVWCLSPVRMHVDTCTNKSRRAMHQALRRGCCFTVRRVVANWQCSETQFASASLDGAIVVWHAQNLTPLKTLTYPEQYLDGTTKAFLYSVRKLVLLSKRYLAAAIGNGYGDRKQGHQADTERSIAGTALCCFHTCFQVSGFRHIEPGMYFIGERLPSGMFSVRVNPIRTLSPL